jgi:hypothetical protein
MHPMPTFISKLVALGVIIHASDSISTASVCPLPAVMAVFIYNSFSFRDSHE